VASLWKVISVVSWKDTNGARQTATFRESRSLEGSQPEQTPSKKVIKDTIIAMEHPTRRLSFFERQLARAFHKSIDVHGNINLNEAANQSYAGLRLGKSESECEGCAVPIL